MAAPTPRYVETTLKYLDRAGGLPVLNERERKKTVHSYDERPMRIHDGRAIAGSLDLETNGFVLLRHQSAVADFSDRERVRAEYFPEMEQVVKALTGAREVLVFGEVLRTDDPTRVGRREPSIAAHVDFSEKTVRFAAEKYLGREEASRRLKRRFMMINLWRGITPVERRPLTVCDAATVRPADLIAAGVRGGVLADEGDPHPPMTESYNVTYSPEHRWYYFPRMQPDELLVFKLCDSQPGAVQYTAHTSFDDPTSPPDAPPRQSFEVRTIAFL